MRRSKLTDPWPPIEFSLPNLDRLEEISRGEHVEQPEMFVEPIDDSREGRLRRILGSVQGEVMGNTLEVRL